MSEYHKIKSVFLRDPNNKHKSFLMWQWSLPELEYLHNNEWEFTEKVDGTNVRIYWDAELKRVSINGRTKDAQMPTFLFDKLASSFTLEKFELIYPDTSLALYGEGYGAKIQKGGADYIKDGCDFILFDVFIGKWLERINVEDIAQKLEIKTVPIVGYGTLTTAIEMCQDGFNSKLRNSEPEGLICKPRVGLLRANGERIITKIKLKDFK